jgi:hypothetical protein
MRVISKGIVLYFESSPASPSHICRAQRVRARARAWTCVPMFARARPCPALFTNDSRIARRFSFTLRTFS